MTASPPSVVIAGAGYAGLHVAQRLGTWLDRSRQATITLVDRNDYHQLRTELPRVASGQRADEKVRVDVDTVLPESVTFRQGSITGFDLAEHYVFLDGQPVPYWRLVLALGSRPNDFHIPGLADRALLMWSADDAVRIRRAVEHSVAEAAQASSPAKRNRLLTVVIGGGGATGVELAGAFAEELPKMASKHGIAGAEPRVIIVEAGHTILAASSPELVRKALDILERLRVEVLTNSAIVEATADGFKLAHGRLVTGGTFIWAGGVKAAEIVGGSGFEVGYNGRIKVDRYLRALGHETVYVAGDVASVPDPATGMSLPPLAQTALSEGESVAENLRNELEGKQVESFHLRSKGFVVSVGARRGVANVSGMTFGGSLAHALKDAIEWEYRNSIKYLRGWAAG